MTRDTRWSLGLLPGDALRVRYVAVEYVAGPHSAPVRVVFKCEKTVVTRADAEREGEPLAIRRPSRGKWKWKRYPGSTSELPSVHVLEDAPVVL